MKSLTLSYDSVCTLSSQQDGKHPKRRDHIIYFFNILLMPTTVMLDLD